MAIGIGNILLLAELVADVCRACKHSTDEYRTISAEVKNMRIVIERHHVYYQSTCGEGGGAWCLIRGGLNRNEVSVNLFHC